MYIKGKICNGVDNRYELNEIWEACGVKEKEEDYQPAIYVIAYCVENESRPIAVGRIQYDGDEYRIGGIYVKKEAMGQGYETFLIKMLLYYAFQQGADIVYSDSDEGLKDFLKKEGFKEIENGS